MGEPFALNSAFAFTNESVTSISKIAARNHRIDISDDIRRNIHRLFGVANESAINPVKELRLIGSGWCLP